MNDKPKTIILTGASGFVGRHLLEDWKHDCRIFAIARRSQYVCNAPVHPNIAWLRADITDAQSLERAFREISSAGGADYLVHLAAYYDFTGDNHPCYRTTNVEGTQRILEYARTLKVKRFVFSSSVAACAFPAPGDAITEYTPPDGAHIYAQSKRAGEALVTEYSAAFPTAIVRFGAVYSDWCEYAPLYTFLQTWLGGSPKARILAGCGESAIPYIHIRDIVRFFRQLFQFDEHLSSSEILLACTSGATSHAALYNLATRYYFGLPKSPILMPAPICGAGLVGMYLLGKLTGRMPFERPWMFRYIDKRLNVDIRKTSDILAWRPAERHAIESRMPFLIEHMKSEPYAWHAKNQAAMRRSPDRPEYLLYTLLLNAEEEIISGTMHALLRYGGPAARRLSHPENEADLLWFVRLIMRLVISSLHMNNRLLLQNYFEFSAFSRFEAGYDAAQIIATLRQLHDAIVAFIERDPSTAGLQKEIYDSITAPMDFAIDEVEHQGQIFETSELRFRPGTPAEFAPETVSARAQLEQTIWECLVRRK